MSRRKKREVEVAPAVESPGDEPGALMLERYGTLLLLVAASVLLKTLIFAPIGWWPFAFVCLVPWLVMVGGATLAPRVYFLSYIFGLVFFLIDMHWLYPATAAGYGALAVYLALYFPLMACALRHAIRRRRWPVGIVLPLVWVGSEMMRAVVISGFPWFFLAHSLHKVLPMIQVSDLVGAYGVSFVVAAVNGAVVDWLFLRWASRGAGGDCGYRWRAIVSTVVASGLLAFTLGYGVYQLNRDTGDVGPRVAVIQGDFVTSVLAEDEEATEEEKLLYYLDIMTAAATESPDLYLLPESPWVMALNPEFRMNHGLSRRSFYALRRHAMDHDAYVITGSGTYYQTPEDLLAPERRYNSAMIFAPDGSEPARYDKVHVVPFGEAVPFRFGRLRFLYFWMNAIMPFSEGGTREYSIFRGESFKTFEMKSRAQGGRIYRYGIPICYEDVMPYVSRRFVCGGSPTKQVDVLLNISNDGWFGRGTQQPQHLAICVFRAVENRVGIARSVNTGMSGFIEPSGRLYDIVTGDPKGRWPRTCGYRVADLKIDSRFTVYARYGDWFGYACAVIWLIVFLDYWVARARGTPAGVPVGGGE